MPALNPANALPFGARILINLQKAETQKKIVIPANAEIQLFQYVLDPGFRRGDDKETF